MKTVVTGSNRGIGLELCRQLKARGDEVIALCRKSSPELNALGVEVIEGIDVADDDLNSQLNANFKHQAVDLLINCAGILRHESLEDMNTNTIKEQFNVNAIGPLRITMALLDKLKKGSKIALITSRMGSIADNTSGTRYGYRMSKAALNMAGASLAFDLKARQIAVAILHPGYVRTEMTGFSGLIDADESATGLIARIDDLTLETSGGFWHENGDRLPW